MATYAFFVPMLGAWCAFAGLISVSTAVAIALYKADPFHSHNIIFTTSLILGFGAGGVLGCVTGTAIAFAVNRVVPWLSQDLPRV